MTKLAWQIDNAHHLIEPMIMVVDCEMLHVLATLGCLVESIIVFAVIVLVVIFALVLHFVHQVQ